MKIGTHNGAFHCDEVLACSMLKLLPQYKDAEIVRTRDQKVLDTCDIVVDVGAVFDASKHRYDHHQKTFNESVSTLMPSKKWVTKLSSAGLVYVHFGKQIISQVLESQDEELIEKVFDKVYQNFVEEIDANDNGISTHDGEPRYQVTTTLSNRVAHFRPNWNDSEQDFDAGFYKAMGLVKPEFIDRIIYYSKVWWPARSLVNEAIEKRFEVHESGRIVELENGGCPYKGHLFELEEEKSMAGEILFAIFIDSNGMWRVMAVPVKDQQFESRLKLHQDWRGLRENDLSAKAGIEGCTFVHAAGFIGGNKTRKGALEMALMTMKAANIC